MDIQTNPLTPRQSGEFSRPAVIAPVARRTYEHRLEAVAAMLDELFARHHGELVQTLKKVLGNQALAEEAAQEAYLRLLKYAQIPDAGKEKSYLFTTATRCSFDILKEERRQGSCRSPAATIHPNAEDSVLAKRAVWRLPPRCRQVFLMHRVLGWRQADIARELDLSVSMVEKHIRKGRRMLEREVQIPKADAKVPSARW